MINCLCIFQDKVLAYIIKKYISKVRESDIVYAPNISSNKIGVELKIPSRSFIKGLRNESY